LHLATVQTQQLRCPRRCPAAAMSVTPLERKREMEIGWGEWSAVSVENLFAVIFLCIFFPAIFTLYFMLLPTRQQSFAHSPNQPKPKKKKSKVRS